MFASDATLQRPRSSRSSFAAATIAAVWKARTVNPAATKTGARPRPARLACDAIATITTARSAEATLSEPGSRASGVRAVAQPATVARISVHDVGVSEATVSRVSRALGYRGYPDMKLSMAEGAGSRPPFSNIPIEIDESDSLITTSGNLAVLLAANLQGTQRLLDGGRLERRFCIHKG